MLETKLLIKTSKISGPVVIFEISRKNLLFFSGRNEKREGSQDKKLLSRENLRRGPDDGTILFTLDC